MKLPNGDTIKILGYYEFELQISEWNRSIRAIIIDIDTDFDDEGRQKVIDYVVKKYGKNQVAQIVTYGTMAAKMSIKDVARVMDLPLPEANALAIESAVAAFASLDRVVGEGGSLPTCGQAL